MVHTPREHADAVVDAVRAAGEQAAHLLFGQTPVRFPLEISAVRCYADAS
jgi:DNA polymerase I